MGGRRRKVELTVDFDASSPSLVVSPPTPTSFLFRPYLSQHVLHHNPESLSRRFVSSEALFPRSLKTKLTTFLLPPSLIAGQPGLARSLLNANPEAINSIDAVCHPFAAVHIYQNLTLLLPRSFKGRSFTSPLGCLRLLPRRHRTSPQEHSSTRSQPQGCEWEHSSHCSRYVGVPPLSQQRLGWEGSGRSRGDELASSANSSILPFIRPFVLKFTFPSFYSRLWSGI